MLHELTPHLPTRRASDLHAGKGDDAMLEARDRDAARLQLALVEASERKTLLAGLVLGHPRVRYLAQFRQPFADGGAFTPFNTQAFALAATGAGAQLGAPHARQRDLGQRDRRIAAELARETPGLTIRNERRAGRDKG